jgi:hypothetical protein
VHAADAAGHKHADAGARRQQHRAADGRGAVQAAAQHERHVAPADLAHLQALARNVLQLLPVAACPQQRCQPASQQQGASRARIYTGERGRMRERERERERERGREGERERW